MSSDVSTHLYDSSDTSRSPDAAGARAEHPHVSADLADDVHPRGLARDDASARGGSARADGNGRESVDSDAYPRVDHDDVFSFDDLGPGRRWSTWLDVQRGCRGPEPRPGWVVTELAAIDTDLGVVKTGKEADVFLVERAVPGDPGRAVLMAAKRYRTAEHRSFRRDESYVEGRRTRRSRDARAIARKSTYGRAVAAGQWATAEFEALGRLWTAGVPVPYPVQIDGAELLMEYIELDGAPAPRLAQVRPDADLLRWYLQQLREAMRSLARAGLTHGDLSPYNILAQGERVVLIDVPQIVDIIANPHGVDLLQRDCHNVCRWFAARGLEVDEGDLLAELIGEAFG